MANKKLKVEVELETAKAKRQAKDLEQTGSARSSATSKLDKSVEKTASSFEHLSGQTARLTRGFAGLAIGMATSYAANYVKDPNTKAGLEYAGNGISGAVSGAMMAGLPGAIVGGLGGILKTYMDKEGEKSAMSKDFELGEQIYAATKAKNERFDSLASTKPGTDIAANLGEVKKIIDNYTKSTAEFVEQVREELKKANPDKEKIANLRRNIEYNRGEIGRYENLQHSLESLSQKNITQRVSTDAVDALSKVGGSFAGSQTGSRVAEDSLKCLREIADNTRGKGGSSWQ